MRRAAMTIGLVAALATWACGANGGAERTAASTPTTEAVGRLSTTTETETAADKGAGAGSGVSTTTTPASTPAPLGGEAPPLESSPAGPEVVDSGSAPAGEWRLLAERQAGGLLCALLKVDGHDQGQVCNEASEQDFNGDDVLRYSILGDGTFVVGVSASGVERLRAELQDGTIVERATAGASFAGSRFVALPLPAQSVVSSLVALGDNGQVFTSFTLNP